MLIPKIHGTALIVVLTLLLLFQSSPGISEEMPLDEISLTAADEIVPLASAEHMVSQIILTPSTPNILKFDEQVTVSFNYSTTEAGGVRIWARPFTGTALTLNYAACGSPIYPVGDGSGTCSFTITAGKITVNKIRFQIWDANQTKKLFQAFIPVNYQFK